KFTQSFVASPNIEALGAELARSLNRPREHSPLSTLHSPFSYEYHRYYPEMLDWVADEITRLVQDEGVPPAEIVVLAPFLPDVLRFSLMNRLEARKVPARSHRPSRALRDEPATRCLLTLAAIAHPDWEICPASFDVAYALMQAIDGLDLVRAQLLTQIAYRPAGGRPTLTSFDQIVPEMKERLTFLLGERYERLRAWIEEYTTAPPTELDHFLSCLFGEILSQAGFGFHRDYDAGRVAFNLIESVQKFRWVAEGGGQEYLEMVQDGVIAAQYIHSWQLRPEDAVLLAPAYTFLMSNRPVDIQFWLDVGSRGWWERLYQPLTQPYVLNRRWPRGDVWTDSDEHAARQETLHRLIQGLLRRCRRQVYLGLSELGEHGREQKGPLLRAIQRVLSRTRIAGQ
ncbi:MAG: hypothetical protein U9R15_08370, partial [Chloroflexota bacterium]|nr:hypothetical protein [Chloroflexota bacterium]